MHLKTIKRVRMGKFVLQRDSADMMVKVLGAPSRVHPQELGGVEGEVEISTNLLG